MIIPILLLLPVTLILIWAYWYLLPRRGGPSFRWFDGVLIALLIVAGVVYMRWALQQPWSSGGDIVAQVMAVAGGYTIFAFGLLGVLVVRRLLSRR